MYRRPPKQPFFPLVVEEGGDEGGRAFDLGEGGGGRFSWGSLRMRGEEKEAWPGERKRTRDQVD